MTLAEVSRQPLAEAVELIRPAKRIAVTAHVNPDADAIGSLLAIMRALQAMGKEVTGVLADPVPRYAGFLLGSEQIVRALPEAELDLLICNDAASIERLGSIYEDNRDRFARTPILNLDHHQTNPRFGTVNLVDADASSSSEIAFQLLTHLPAPIDAGTATSLLFGIFGDTGSFQNAAATPSSLQVAAQLVELGADNQKIAFQLFEAKSYAATRLWGLALASAELDRDRHVVFAFVSQEMVRETGGRMDETEGVAEFLRGVEEAGVVMLLKETPEGEIRVSMRSGPHFDVSAIAVALNGGGHRQAAGCTLPGPFSAARGQLIATFDRVVGAQP